MNPDNFWWWVSHVIDISIIVALAVFMGGVVVRLFLREVAELREHLREFRKDSRSAKATFDINED